MLSSYQLPSERISAGLSTGAVELSAAFRTYSRWSYDSRCRDLWPLASGFWPLAFGLWPLASALCPLPSGLWPLASGLWPLASGTASTSPVTYSRWEPCEGPGPFLLMSPLPHLIVSTWPETCSSSSSSLLLCCLIFLWAGWPQWKEHALWLRKDGCQVRFDDVASHLEARGALDVQFLRCAVASRQALKIKHYSKGKFVHCRALSCTVVHCHALLCKVVHTREVFKIPTTDSPRLCNCSKRCQRGDWCRCSFLSNEAWLERDIWTAETLSGDSDDVAMSKLIGLHLSELSVVDFGSVPRISTVSYNFSLTTRTAVVMMLP